MGDAEGRASAGTVDRLSEESRTGSGSRGGGGASAERVISVAELNRQVAGMIDRQLPPVRVAGEVSNLTRAASGHWYFTLKDSVAQVRAVMFRGRAQTVGFPVRDGIKVEVRALASLYEPRGEFQLVVESMREAGAGDLYQRFVQLKDKLQREGLFDPARKRLLPAWPRAVGVLTSVGGAALHDVLSTLARRAPAIPVIVYPTLVQGAQAPAAIVTALERAASRGECDVLLVVRGGGSIEDLWAFNDESVARRIASFPVPVVSGVGHETDFTIADFVADARAPTPTGAAALVSPDTVALRSALVAHHSSLARAIGRVFDRADQRIDLAARQLRPPSAQWRERGLRLHGLAIRLNAALRIGVEASERRLLGMRHRLRAPDTARAAESIAAWARALSSAGRQTMTRREDQLVQLAHRLEAANPANVLARGFAIVRTPAGRVVGSAAATRPGQPLDLLFSDGEVGVTVNAPGSAVPPATDPR